MEALILIWILLVVLLIILLTIKASVYLKYNKMIMPEMYSEFNSGIEFLCSFSVKRFIVFFPIAFRKKELEKKNDELKKIGNRLSFIGVIYFITIFLIALFTYLLVASNSNGYVN